MAHLVHLWEFDIPLEQLTLLGQMALSKYKIETLVHLWTNGLVEVQNKNLGTQIRMFLQNSPKGWAHQIHMYAFAHNSRPLSALNVSPHELVFHIRPRIPLTFKP